MLGPESSAAEIESVFIDAIHAVRERLVRGEEVPDIAATVAEVAAMAGVRVLVVGSAVEVEVVEGDGMAFYALALKGWKVFGLRLVEAVEVYRRDGL